MYSIRLFLNEYCFVRGVCIWATYVFVEMVYLNNILPIYLNLPGMVTTISASGVFFIDLA